MLGGHGFVGSAFVRHADAQGVEVRAVGRDDYASAVDTSCDVLINAAGNARKYRADAEPRWDFDESVRSVLHSLHDFEAETYVYISSVAVYAEPGYTAATPEDASIDPNRLSPYAAHKYMAEQLVRRYAKRWLIIRLGGVVGPGLSKGPVFDLIEGSPLWVASTSTFQFIHTDRVAEIVDALLAQGRTNEVLNIAGRDALTLDAAASILGCEQPTARVGAPTEHWSVDVQRAHALVGLPTTEEALRALVGEREALEVHA
ncbi:MAG: SDR family oxidoreductase [Chloroflexota bacterium]